MKTRNGEILDGQRCSHPENGCGHDWEKTGQKNEGHVMWFSKPRRGSILQIFLCVGYPQGIVRIHIPL